MYADCHNVKSGLCPVCQDCVCVCVCVYMNVKEEWYWYLDSKVSESVVYQVVDEGGAILFRLPLNYKAVVSVIK